MPSRVQDTKTLVPGIAHTLRELIWKGTLRPGEHIHQAEWAEVLGVSLIPLREAMRMLEAEGLLQVLANRGVRVTPISAAEIEEWLLEFKGTLYALLPISLPLLTPEAFVQLRSMAKDLDNQGASAELHLNFWRTLIAPCGMPRLQMLAEGLIWRLGRYFLNGGKEIFSAMREIRPNREEFLDACERRNPEEALALMVEFARVRMEAYLAYLASVPPQVSSLGR